MIGRTENRSPMLEQAVALQDAGRFAEAQNLYRQILRREPGNARATHMLGRLALDAGAAEAARAILEEACRLDPGNAAAQNDLGRALLAAGKAPEALARFERALAHDPHLASAHSNRGLALSNLSRHDEALAGFERALALAPDQPQIHNNFGTTLVRLGRYAEALERFDKAAALAPDDPGLHYNRADTLKNLRREEESLAAYGRAIALAPDFVEALFNRGLLLARMERLGEALADIDSAVQRAPASANMLVRRGAVLGRMGRESEALAAFDQAIALAPDLSDAPVARLLAIARTCGLEEALAFGRRAACNPRIRADIEFNMAQLLLQRGRWKEGWPLYESRKYCARPTESRSYPQPLWPGNAPLAGKKLYVYAEQGMGDVVLFSRYLALARARGATIVFSPYDSLVRLMEGLEHGITIQPWKTAPERFDYHLPLLSLPQAFSNGPDSVPAVIPYLHAEAALIEKWRARIGTSGFRIGVNWSGGIRITNAGFGLERSFPLRLLARLAKMPGVRLVSLQKEAAARELASLPAGMAVEQLGEDFDSGPDGFVDTAAAMASLDLIISCDTSVAHLAGALGRPVWLALGADPEWRWLLERSDSPWYPTMSLFRQTEPGAWPEVFAAMEKELESLLGSHREAGRT